MCRMRGAYQLILGSGSNRCAYFDTSTSCETKERRVFGRDCECFLTVSMWKSSLGTLVSVDLQSLNTVFGLERMYLRINYVRYKVQLWAITENTKDLKI